MNLYNLNIKIYADGANLNSILELNKNPIIKGFTLNPTLLKASKVKEFLPFAKEVLSHIKDKPISFEVFSDDFNEMYRQAKEISSWGENVYVKIPITNTKKQACYELVSKLAKHKVKLNVTALMTLDQVRQVADVLDPNIPSYVSVFAGRIADTGRDPIPLMAEAVNVLKALPASELIWASPRELLNIFQADEIGCQVITVTNDIIKKLSMIGYDLELYSLDTVQMFYNDAKAAGYKL